MADLPLSRARGYVAAVGLTALALALSLVATPWFGANVSYVQFYPVILLTAWLGGVGPGLLATGLSAVAAMYFLLGPAGLAVGETADLVSLALSRSEHLCHVTVHDHGPGMPADILNHVFTPFFTTKARGSGLGLPTAKRLIEAHNGQITVTSPPAGGTSFHIQLPL